MTSSPLAHSPQQHTYAQFAEDILIRLLLELHNRLQPGGFYVDVGAHHPITHSNTHLFHEIFGFSGVNIDADSDLIDEFCRVRPNDTNICAAVGSQAQSEVEFTVLEQRGMSSISKATLHERRELNIIERRIVKAMTLTEILDASNAPSEIDILNVDVEGSDLAVIESLNFNKYVPFCICIEELDFDMHRPQHSAIFRFLAERGYLLYSRAWVSSLYFNPSISRHSTRS